MIKPILSIIIVSYNTKDITLDCLTSILKDKKLYLGKGDIKEYSIPTEIIIVDNNSHDGSVQSIRDFVKKNQIPDQYFQIIANKDNSGFGKANNQAAKIAQGNYLLLLNSDTIVLHSGISQSLDWLCSHPESYGCTAQLLNRDQTIQASGGYFPNLLNTFTWLSHLDDLPLVNTIVRPFHPHTPTFYTHDRYYLKDHPQDWVTGAFMMLRKNVYQSVNGFDESYFMYGEEMEMCYRIHQQFPKQTLWYLVGPQIIHLGGASAKSKSQIFDREYQGIISFFKKHRSGFETKIVQLLVGLNRFLHRFI